MYHAFGKLSYDLWTFCRGVPRFHVEVSHGGKVWTIQRFEDEDKTTRCNLRITPVSFFFWAVYCSVAMLSLTRDPQCDKQGWGVRLRQFSD